MYIRILKLICDKLLHSFSAIALSIRYIQTSCVGQFPRKRRARCAKSERNKTKLLFPVVISKIPRHHEPGNFEADYGILYIECLQTGGLKLIQR